MHAKFSYKTFKARIAYHALITPVDPDAYISSSPEEEAIRQAVAEGYRWVRTDHIELVGDVAIFEKEE